MEKQRAQEARSRWKLFQTPKVIRKDSHRHLGSSGEHTCWISQSSSNFKHFALLSGDHQNISQHLKIQPRLCLTRRHPVKLVLYVTMWPEFRFSNYFLSTIFCRFCICCVNYHLCWPFHWECYFCKLNAPSNGVVSLHPTVSSLEGGIFPIKQIIEVWDWNEVNLIVIIKKSRVLTRGPPKRANTYRDTLLSRLSTCVENRPRFSRVEG